MGAPRFRWARSRVAPYGGSEMIRSFLFLVIVVLAVWFFREDIQTWLTRGDAIEMEEPSEELAIRAEETFEAIADGTARGEVRLSEMELQSYVEYRLAQRLPAGVTDPAVDLLDSTVAMSAELDLRELEVGGNAVEMLRRMLGDSATIQAELYPTVGAPGEGRVEVLSLQAGRVPLTLAIGAILDGAGIPADGQTAIIEIPDDVESIRVQNEEIVLIRGR